MVRQIAVSGLLAVMACGTWGYAVASDAATRIGVVDMNKVFQQAPQMPEINRSLEKQFKQRQQNIVESEKNLQTKVEKFRRDSAVMSATQQDELTNQIEQEKRELLKQKQDFQDDLELAKHKVMQTLGETVKKSVDAVAKQKHYDLILSNYDIPYVSSSLDITDAVIAQLK